MCVEGVAHGRCLTTSVIGGGLHAQPVAENGAAGERAGGIHGENAHRMTLLAQRGCQSVHQSALARSASPRDADNRSLPGVREQPLQE